jgi:hypothetical protein
MATAIPIQVQRQHLISAAMRLFICGLDFLLSSSWLAPFGTCQVLRLPASFTYLPLVSTPVES